MGLTRLEAFQILGLEEGCTEKEIRERFKKLALKWHPDKNFHNPDEAQKKFQVISAAYSKLISKEEDDVRITLGDIFSDFHRYYNPHAHVFCDCDICQDEWGGMDFSDIVGSDSDMFSDDEGELIFSCEIDDRYYADQLLRAFAERLYRNFNGPSRMARKARETAWEESAYKRNNISAEEASRNADELLKAEEKEKREAEKRKQKNKKKRDAKRKKKAKMHQDKSGSSSSFKSSESIKNDGSGASSLADRDGDGETDTEDDEIDISSAFVARASKKNSQPPATATTTTWSSQQSANPGASGGGLGGSEGDSSSSAKIKGTFSHKFKEDKENLEPRQGSGNSTGSKMNGRSGGSASNGAGASEATSSTTETLARSRQLAGLGNIAAKDGHFSEAVRRFTEAIELYPFDHRYFGNRSFCFDYLEEYDRALEDADAALRLDTSWPKGYYRQGRAYAGLKRLEDAESCYIKALQLDPNYKDAEEELFKIRLEQLNGMGFTLALSKVALREYKTVQAAIDAILAGKVTKLEIDDHSHVYSPTPMPDNERPTLLSSSSPQRPPRHQQQQQQQQQQHSSPGPQQAAQPSSQKSQQKASSNYSPSYNHTRYEVPPRMRQQQQQQQSSKQSQQHKQESQPKSQSDTNSQGKALWVGNITTTSITEGMIRKLFQPYGEIVSVRMLRERRCAFVNFAKSKSAAEALKELQGKNLEGCYLLLRYPENPFLVTPLPVGSSSKKIGPVNGNECYYWRTNGCAYGSKCRYRHIPANKGIDGKK